MTQQWFKFFHPVQRFFKSLFKTETLRSYRNKWLTQSLLILWAAFLTAGIQIAFPLTIKSEKAYDSSANLISSTATVVQSLPDARELVEKGRKFYDLGQFSQAVTVLQQAEEIFEVRGDELRQAMALSNLSLALQQLGQWQKAEEHIAESLHLLQTGRTMGDSNDRWKVYAQTLDIQGSLQLQRGRAEIALQTWKQAADIYAEMGDRIGSIRSSIKLAEAQQALGLYRQARTTLETANESLDEQPDSPIKSTALRSLGDVLQMVGDLKLSEKVLQESIDVAQRLQSLPELSAALLSLGNAERALGNSLVTLQDPASKSKHAPLDCLQKSRANEAINFYQQAERSYLQSAATDASPIGQIQAEVNRLSVLLELQKWSELQKSWPKIIFKIANIYPSQTAIYARINLAQSLVCLKQASSADAPSWKEIAQLLSSAIQQAKSLGDSRLESYALGALGGLYLEVKDASNALKLTQQALMLAQSIKAADIAYKWQWQLGYLLGNKGDISGAIASYTEAVETLKSLRNDLVALNSDVQFSFRDNVEPVYRQLVALLLQSDQPSQENLKQARNAIEALQLAELENFFREACLEAKPKQIDEVVDKIDGAAALIYPIILKNSIEAIVKLPNQNELRHYKTRILQSQVESILEEMGKKLREPDRVNDVKQLSQQLYNWLIQPGEADLEKMQVKTIVFVLDGSLRNIPMAVLYDKKQKQYLVEKYAIAVNPGLQMLDPKPSPRKKLNALTGGMDKERFLEGRNFVALENVEFELNKIQSEVSSSQELFNQSFTESNLKKQIEADAFSIVHLATHGEFSSNAEETFIVTWDKLLKAKEFDRLMRISDSSKSISVELLVLSACQTAVGDKRAALGLAGIAVRAGASSTLATLWSVDDRSNAELMIQFYRELIDSKVTKAEALRRAQVAQLTKDESPYYWAGYLLVGNWL